MWKCFTPEERKLMHTTSSFVHYKRGDVIYNAGDTPKSIMCLLKGRVKVVKPGVTGGKPQIVRVLKPAELFAYRAYFCGTEYVTSAYAMDDCLVTHFPLRNLREMIRTNPDVAFFLLHHLSDELGFSDNRIISLTQKHVRGRLAEALLTLEDRCGTGVNGDLDVRITREELASFSNMTTNNAIRTLSAFAHEGIVILKNKQIIIRNHKALEEISRLE